MREQEIAEGLKTIHQEKTAIGEPITFKFCPRELWGAVPPGPGCTPEDLPLDHPVGAVRYTDTATATCRTPRECFPILQNIQRVDMEVHKLPDIRYNFLVGGDGTVYEGRGWLIDASRPKEFDRLKGDCIDIGYIGNLKDSDQEFYFPTDIQEATAYNWSVYGPQGKNYVDSKFEAVQGYYQD